MPEIYIGKNFEDKNAFNDFCVFYQFCAGARAHTHTIIKDVFEYNRGNTRKQNCCLVATFQGS